MGHSGRDHTPGEETGESFTSIDWEAAGTSWRLRTETALATVLLVAIAAVAVYDLRFVAEEPFLPVEMTARDYMLVAFLVVAGYLLAPLARRPERLVQYWYRYPKDLPSLLGLGIVAAFVVVGFLGPILLDPPELAIERIEQPPAFTSVREELVTTCHGEISGGQCHGTLDHLLGTNREGRDVLTYVVYGTRTALEMAVLVSMIAVPIATAIGTTAAYLGGRIDDLLMRYVDLQQIIPAFFIYIVLFFLYKPSQTMLVVVFGLFSWGGIARVVRSEVKREREEMYVMAARNAGAGAVATIRSHIWPNVAGTIITAMTLQIPFLITIEAALSFLNLGDELVFSWGKLIEEGSDVVLVRPWITLVPGAVLSVTILGFYLLGDALQRVFDPKLE